VTKTKFLITGATGATGGHAARQLLEKEHATQDGRVSGGNVLPKSDTMNFQPYFEDRSERSIQP
jgi:nucleoside-diphosphate-sugar epimerase